MIRTLSIIAAAGFLVCLACFTAVFALGGGEVVRDGFVIPAVLERLEEGDSYEPSDTPRVEKTIAWAGAEALTIEVPADVVYIQAPTPTITVSGTPRLVDRVRVEGGRVFFVDEDENHVSWGNRRRLTVTITAPKVTRFEVNGSADVEIKGYDQPTLAIEIAGSGEVDAIGKTTTLDLSIAGSGEADLRNLAVTDASIAVAGSGDATVGPTGAVEVAIAGSGDVTLTRQPAKLDSDIAGSGDLQVEN
ncbi:DUF2807 domain-containing protein [Caulobacter sp. SLTY]|uniref:GIN domain-containing protein n=1 Tax=Caulobacter sp. SLTY TaxID=2683262 RepID=UPI001412BFDB|nr:DUF2807 domain-containing protein [Caulobacter sp. SLTY]NBB15970.1 DUF2807 domain-containing protein [Caulobacter sp. SLTY]